MLSFASDYTEGACEEILQKLAETNRESLPGYGMDRYCQSAARKIQEATGCPEAEVYFWWRYPDECGRDQQHACTV